MCYEFFHNDKEIFNLTSSTLKQRIVGIFGNRYNEKLVPVKEETSLVVVNGFVGKPEFSKKLEENSFSLSINDLSKVDICTMLLVMLFKT